MNRGSVGKADDPWGERVQPGNVYRSLFANGRATISLHKLQAEWIKWSAPKRLEFVGAYSHKPEIDPEDRRILEFLFDQEDGRIHEMLAIMLLCHPDKEWALKKLRELVRNYSYDRRNFLKALSLMKDVRADQTIAEVHRDAADIYEQMGDATDENRARELVLAAYLLGKQMNNQSYWNEFLRYESHQNRHMRDEAARLKRLHAALAEFEK